MSLTEAEIRELFDGVDTDGSGAIDFDEFKEAISDLFDTLTDKDARTLFNYFDTDKNGTIDFDEFKSLAECVSGENSDVGFIKLLFIMADDNGDGLLSPSEFAHCVSAIDSSLTEEEAEIIFKKIDANGDGCLSFEEFQTFIEDNLN